MSYNDRIRDFIVGEMEFHGMPDGLTGDYPLLESGAIDSMGIMQLVDYLESSFGVAVDEEDIVPENFESIDAISALVETKRSS